MVITVVCLLLTGGELDHYLTHKIPRGKLNTLLSCEGNKFPTGAHKQKCKDINIQQKLFNRDIDIDALNSSEAAPAVTAYKGGLGVLNMDLNERTKIVLSKSEEVYHQFQNKLIQRAIHVHPHHQEQTQITGTLYPNKSHKPPNFLSKKRQIPIVKHNL